MSWISAIERANVDCAWCTAEALRPPVHSGIEAVTPTETAFESVAEATSSMNTESSE